MFSRLTLPLGAAAMALSLLATAPIAVAQDTATFAPAKLIVSSADGEELEYTVGDASFYVSTIEGYDDVPSSVDFSLSLSAITPINADLLEWTSQTEGKDKNETRTITIIGTDGSEAGEEVTYEITDAKVTSVSFSQSTYGAPSVALSLTAGSLTINGVLMN